MRFRAAMCRELGPPGVLRVEPCDGRPLAPSHVRVALVACGVNFPDLLMVAGRYQFKPPVPFVPGLEAAGTVIEVGADVRGVEVGAHVITRSRTGGFAEQIAVPASDAIALPDGFSFVEGACFLAAHTTAYHALKTRGELAPGQTLVVFGAGGGVGLAAVEIGVHLGARVIAVASNGEKLAAARAKGAHNLVDYRADDPLTAIAALTDGRGADVIYDPVGRRGEDLTRMLRFGGKILVVGFAAEIPQFAANRILLKGATVIGVRTGEAGRHCPSLRARELADLFRLATGGKLRPHIQTTFKLEDCALALQWLADRRAIGRVALLTADASA